MLDTIRLGHQICASYMFKLKKQWVEGCVNIHWALCAFGYSCSFLIFEFGVLACIGVCFHWIFLVDTQL